MSQNNEPQVSIDISNELGKNISIHKNVRQEIILTTGDKLKLVLIQAKESMASQRDWWTPLGLLISFIATLCTADFKDTLGLSKDTWKALFILLSIAATVWLIIDLKRLFKYYGKDNLDDIIQQIKLQNDGVQQVNESSDEASL